MSDQTKPMRCAIYSRVSTGKQDAENQLIQLRRFAESQGWQVSIEYCDEITGSTSDRPQFKAMLSAASRREFDVVLFWALDRLSREGPLATLQHLQRLTSYGVKWRSFTEQYIDSCGIFAEAVISIMAKLAKQERIRISERTKSGLEKARRDGKVLGRPRVAAAAQVQELRAQGKSWNQIAKQLNIGRSTAQMYGAGDPGGKGF